MTFLMRNILMKYQRLENKENKENKENGQVQINKMEKQRLRLRVALR
jgi:hypothetical protein